MASYVYDEEASAALHMDVVHEVDDSPPSKGRWIDAMRRLNSIEDPLARKILELHRDCGSGAGECDSMDDPEDVFRYWGCETTALVASHFGVEFPSGRSRD